MSKRTGSDREPSLFDLPLRDETGVTHPRDLGQRDLLLVPEADDGADVIDRTLREQLPVPEPETPEPADDFQAPDLADRTFIESAGRRPGEDDPGDEVEGKAEEVALVGRLLGGLVDFGVQLLTLGIAVGGAWRMEVPLAWSDWAPFAVLAFVFSFLYWFIPLAFWGRTPGMAWVGQIARSLDDEPLSFAQTTLRWVGALLTLSLAGLPILLSLVKGRSLSDRLSETKTVMV